MASPEDRTNDDAHTAEAGAVPVASPLMPETFKAEMHRKMSEHGSAKGKE